MESTEGHRGRDSGSQRRSPLDLIINQIRRKRSASDRKPLGRFLSWSSDRAMIREDAETDTRSSVAPEAADGEQDAGWGRVRAFLQRLGKTVDSGRISLSHCDLTATDLLELATLLPFVSQLEELDLSWNELIGGGLRALTSHMNHTNYISTLKLSGCRLNPDDITALGDALSCLPSVEILDLSWNGALGGGGLQGLVGKLQLSLTELHLVACELTAADGTLLGGILSPLSRLYLLDVSCNSQLTDGIKELASSLPNTPSLTTLLLQAVGLSANSLAALGDSLQYVPSLRRLDLSRNKGLSGHLQLVTSHLSHLSLLEDLDLHLSGLTCSDIQALAQVLPSLMSLTVLNVSSNQDAGEAMHALVSALPLTHMKCLPLNNCGLTNDSFTALVRAVPYLRCVDVSWCKVVGGRLLLLLNALQPSVLQELRLSSCELTTQDIHHLASASRGGFLSSLRVLDLSYNGLVRDEGWASLLTSGGLGSLEELDLSLRPLTLALCSGWLPTLLRALPRLTALKQLGLQCWTIGAKDKVQLEHSLKKRNILLEMDTDVKDETNKPPNQDKETQPEE